jgi:hypothetical protein
VRAARLFHTVVVLGTALGSACGGRSSEPASTGSNAGSAGVAGGGSTVTNPSDCEYIAQFRCESYAPRAHCVCDPSLAQNAAACGGAPKLLCAQAVCVSGPEPTICLSQTPNVDCHCVPDAPAAPSDCPGGPGQFECSAYTPEFQGCDCNAALPGNPSDCSPSDSFECVAYAPSYYACKCDTALLDEAECLKGGSYCYYTCASDTPRYGCQCNCIQPIA